MILDWEPSHDGNVTTKELCSDQTDTEYFIQCGESKE